MGLLFAYSIETSVLLAVMYLAYKWSLASEGQHGFNRMMLWSIYIVSMILPLSSGIADLFPTTPATPAGEISDISIEIGTLSQVITTDEDTDSQLQTLIVHGLLWTYVIGMITITIHTSIVASRIYTIVHKGEKLLINGHTVILIDDEKIAPFSVMGLIVMSRRDFAENGELIFIHESNHVRLHHWADLLLAQIVAILQWYNPAVWLMREEFRTVHEYQADAGVISSGVNMKEYQMLLIKKAVGTRFQSLANSLNHSKLKKRITMMYNQNTSKSRLLRALVIAPALGGALLVTNLTAVADVVDMAGESTLTEVTDHKDSNYPAVEQEQSSIPATTPTAPEAKTENSTTVSTKMTPIISDEPKTDFTIIAYGTTNEDEKTTKDETENPDTQTTVSASTEGTVYSVVDVMPQYPGGEMELMKYLASSIRYPKDAQENGINGRVLIQFVIDKNGKATSPEIVKGVSPSIDEEAKRVVLSLPDFEPGRLDGKPVNVSFTLPLVFKLAKKQASDNKDRSSNGFSVKEAMAKGVKVILDGKEIDNIDDIDPKNIKSIDVIKNESDKYPNGAIIITSKDSNEETVPLH